MHTEKFCAHKPVLAGTTKHACGDHITISILQICGGKRLVGVRCDIISAGWVIAESITSNTRSGPIELFKNEDNRSIICRGSGRA